MYGRDALLGSGAEEPLSRENEMDRMPRNTESRQRRLSTSIRVVVRRPSVPIRQRLITPNSSIRVGVTDDEESEAPPSSPRASILPKVDSKILFRETSAIISFEGIHNIKHTLQSNFKLCFCWQILRISRKGSFSWYEEANICIVFGSFIFAYAKAHSLH